MLVCTGEGFLGTDGLRLPSIRGQPATRAVTIGIDVYALCGDGSLRGPHDWEVKVGNMPSDAKMVAFGNKIYLAKPNEVIIVDPIARPPFQTESIAIADIASGELLSFALTFRQLFFLIKTADGSVLWMASRDGGKARIVDTKKMAGDGPYLVSGSSAVTLLAAAGKMTIDNDGQASAVQEASSTEVALSRAVVSLNNPVDSCELIGFDGQKDVLVQVPSKGCFWFPRSTGEPLDSCFICLCELEDDSSITLDCGHAFHIDCLKACVDRSEDYVDKGQRIVFNMARCPGGCGELLRHPVFPKSKLIVDRYTKVLADTAQRAAVEYPGQKVADVIDKYLHYVCFKCHDPFWGGNKDCAAMMTEPQTAPGNLLCEQCQTDFRCSTHGREYVVYKCEYCCRPAVHLSFGYRRLCEECVKKKTTVSSPCLGSGCPLPKDHPMEHSYPIGCLLCLQPEAFDIDRIEACATEES